MEEEVTVIIAPTATASAMVHRLPRHDGGLRHLRSSPTRAGDRAVVVARFTISSIGLLPAGSTTQSQAPFRFRHGRTLPLLRPGRRLRLLTSLRRCQPLPIRSLTPNHISRPIPFTTRSQGPPSTRRLTTRRLLARHSSRMGGTTFSARLLRPARPARRRPRRHHSPWAASLSVSIALEVPFFLGFSFCSPRS